MRFLILVLFLCSNLPAKDQAYERDLKLELTQKKRADDKEHREKEKELNSAHRTAMSEMRKRHSSEKKELDKKHKEEKKQAEKEHKERIKALKEFYRAIERKRKEELQEKLKD